MIICIIFIWVIIALACLLFFYAAGKINKECDKRATEQFKDRNRGDGDKNDLS